MVDERANPVLTTPHLRVLVMTDYYPPGTKAGGPVRSVSRLCAAESQDHDVTVITRDRDLGDTAPYDMAFRLSKSTNLAVEVNYVTANYWHIISLARHNQRVRSFDIMYLNSFFSPKFTLWPLALCRLGLIRPRMIVIAPRGELADPALSIKSWKKLPVGKLLKKFGLLRNVVWHATSTHEAGDIETFMKPRVVKIVEHSSVGPQPVVEATHPLEDGVLRLCQVGRVVAIKNLKITLRALREVTALVELTIVGQPEDAEYWRECKRYIAALPLNITVVEAGHLEAAGVVKVLESSDAMILPTKGENFGHAIAEALAVGCPVLIPPTTMWTDMVRAGAGRLIDAEDVAFVTDAIVAQVNMNYAERTSQRRTALDKYTAWWRQANIDTESLFTLAWHHKLNSSSTGCGRNPPPTRSLASPKFP